MKLNIIAESKSIKQGESKIFVELEDFQKCWKQCKLTDDDLRDLQNKILTEEPEADLGSGLYKFRFAPKSMNKGQSGAYRILYIDVIISSKIYLIYCFPKNKQANIDQKDLKYFRLLASLIKDQELKIKNEKT